MKTCGPITATSHKVEMLKGGGGGGGERLFTSNFTLINLIDPDKILCSGSALHILNSILQHDAKVYQFKPRSHVLTPN